MSVRGAGQATTPALGAGEITTANAAQINRALAKGTALLPPGRTTFSERVVELVKCDRIECGRSS
jgi:hypothetical protein